MRRTALFVLLALALALPAAAQSQATNGSIEGTIADSSGGRLPGVSVTVTNTETGAQRTVVTNEAGIFRAPLLPLGTYKVVAELEGFKKHEETGIKLSVGQTAALKIVMGVGTLNETVTVSAEDRPALELARIDIGHTMSDQEVHSLPLVARNPYNFALVQPGVTGIENVEFGVPRLAANGAPMRINYQIDGNTNTEKDRAGLRLLPMSEVMIQEVKVVTTGFAPEFGQTMGMVYNAVTPSGTNTFRGQASYLFRRDPFSAFPFFFGCGSTTPAKDCPDVPADATKPSTKVDTYTANVGGPILKNRLFFYGGLERTRRDLSSLSPITVDPAIVASVGVKPQPATVPNVQTGEVHHRQGRLPDQRQPPDEPPLGAVQERRAVQQRQRRHQHAGAGHGLPRRDGLGRQPADLDVRLEPAERVARAVRAPAPAVDGQRRLGQSAGHHHHRRHRVRRPVRRHRPGQPGLRLQAAALAGRRQLHHRPGQAQLQDGVRLAEHLRRAHRGAAVHLHVPEQPLPTTPPSPASRRSATRPCRS